MKLTCNVEVNCRLLSSTNAPVRRKAQRACLSIARQSVKNNDLWMLLQTATNKFGTKYKVDKNIEKVFTKFVNDGKATIRFVEPPHDLIIQSDALQLKSFLHILKLGLSKKIDPSVLAVSNLNPKNLTTQKTKIVIKQKSDYPVLEGFPRTTEQLYLTNLERQTFDRQILRLQSLRLLDLSGNRLSNLPNELGTLPNLTELYLSSNSLKTYPETKWSWINETNVQRNLRLLDISNNKISKLPEQIGKLSSLVTLKIGDNSLSTIPQSIGSLIRLKYLEVQKNNLDYLPGSMMNLRLNHLNVSSNAFSLKELPCESVDGVPRLIDIAARIVIDSRTHYDASKIPFTLVEYLDGAQYCVCGKTCFGTFVRQLVFINLHQMSGSITSSGNSSAPLDCYFCCTKCLKRYSKQC